jgi:hypothetical protein
LSPHRRRLVPVRVVPKRSSCPQLGTGRRRSILTGSRLLHRTSASSRTRSLNVRCASGRPTTPSRSRGCERTQVVLLPTRSALRRVREKIRQADARHDRQLFFFGFCAFLKVSSDFVPTAGACGAPGNLCPHERTLTTSTGDLSSVACESPTDGTLSHGARPCHCRKNVPVKLNERGTRNTKSAAIG